MTETIMLITGILSNKAIAYGMGTLTGAIIVIIIQIILVSIMKGRK